MFFENYRFLYLHAPDEVVLGINEFLEAINNSRPNDDEEMASKKKRIARSMLVLRRQFNKKTKLNESHFEHAV